MGFSPENKEYIAAVASEVLSLLSDISAAAARALSASRTALDEALACANAANEAAAA